MITTGKNGFLKFNGNRIGRCRNVRFDIERELLATTKQGDIDESYLLGKRNASGSATLLYDPDDTVAVTLLNTVLSDATVTCALELVLDNFTGNSIPYTAVVHKVGTSIAYGEAHACDISFRASGKPTGEFSQ